MQVRGFTFVLLFFMAFVTNLQAQTATGTSDAAGRKLKERADAVYALGDSVEGIAQGQALFNYVDYLKDKGDDQKTLHYLVEALKRRPTALSYQVLCAQLLEKIGKKDKAEELAKLIIECAEDDEMQVAARRILGEKVDLSLPPLARVEGDDPAIVLVPIGKPDVLLLREIAASLHQRLGVPILIQDAHIAVPKPNRDRLKQYLEEMRGDVMAAKDTPGLQADLKRQSLTLQELKDDATLESFLRNVAAGLDRQAATELVHPLDFYRLHQRQYDGDECVDALRTAVAAVRRDKVAYIALTNLDIFSQKNNFVYSLSPPGHTVLSYSRFRADAPVESPDRARLKTRIRKLCLGCVALMYEVDRCSNPKCPASYQNGLDEHDAKTEEYCSSCRKGLEQVLGHPINPAP